jgi:hypothetical protein
MIYIETKMHKKHLGYEWGGKKATINYNMDQVLNNLVQSFFLYPDSSDLVKVVVPQHDEDLLATVGGETAVSSQH